MKQKSVFILGIIVTVVATLVRLSAHSIARPQKASWGGQVEATSFYAKQLAITDISNLFLAFGLVLVASAIIFTMFNENINKS